MIDALLERTHHALWKWRMRRLPNVTLIEAETTEPVLDDDYMVWQGYAYIADGKQIESPISGSVKQLCKAIKAKEIRKCDISKRGLFDRYGFKIVDQN